MVDEHVPLIKPNFPQKSTGIYRNFENIQHLKVHLTLRNETEQSNLGKTIRWHQKLFSRMEKDFFNDIDNCSSDLDHKYHENVLSNTNFNKENDIGDGLFTYVTNDRFAPDPFVRNPLFLDRLKSLVRTRTDDSVVIDADDVQMMSIMLEVDSDSSKRQEHSLCTMTYDVNRHILRIYPDFCHNSEGAIYWYNLRTPEYDLYYSIEDVSERPDRHLVRKENDIIKTISTRHFTTRSIHKQFESIEGTHQIHLFFEILYGSRFSYDNLYVQYTVRLVGDRWRCLDETSLRGQTNYSRQNASGTQHFSHNFHIVLIDHNDQEQFDLSQNPMVYFEVTSRDALDRYRCEGVTYMTLPLTQSGYHDYRLHCYRLKASTWFGNLRRSFIGDNLSYEDEDFIWINGDKSAVLNKFGLRTVATGELGLRLQVLHQTVPPKGRQQIQRRHDNDDLIRHIDRVVDDFEKIRQQI